MLPVTTYKQAWDILRRNEGLLTALMEVKSGNLGPSWLHFGTISYWSGNVGCPHCKESSGCTTCAWNPQHLEKVHPCYDEQFNGVTLIDVRSLSCVSVVYQWTKETIRYNRNDITSFDSDLDKCIRFVQGHIDWAKSVLNS